MAPPAGTEPTTQRITGCRSTNSSTDHNTDIWIRSTCDALVKNLVFIKLTLLEILGNTVNLIREHGVDRFRIRLIEDVHVKICINLDKDKVIILET